LGFPESPVMRDPCRRIFHGLSGQPAAVYPAVDLAVEQPRRFKHAQVLGDRGQRHQKRLSQFRDHRFAACQSRQDRAPRGIRQRTESGVQGQRVIVNHMV